MDMTRKTDILTYRESYSSRVKKPMMMMKTVLVQFSS